MVIRRYFSWVLVFHSSDNKKISIKYLQDKIFYCDPQASWQKPHIEKNHEFIRYVIPRGKTFKGYTQEDMTLIANHINSTTRPGLEYKSPYDLVETEEMKKLLEMLNMSPVAADEICLSPKLLSKEQE